MHSLVLVQEYVILVDMSLHAGPPEGEIHVPDSVVKYIGSRESSVVWVNELGGLTFRVTERDQVAFIK